MYICCATVDNIYSVLVVQSSLLTKWLIEGVMVRARVMADARARKCLLFFPQNVVDVFVFSGLVASCRECKCLIYKMSHVT